MQHLHGCDRMTRRICNVSPQQVLLKYFNDLSVLSCSRILRDSARELIKHTQKGDISISIGIGNGFNGMSNSAGVNGLRLFVNILSED